MNPLSPYDILTLWEEGQGRVPFEKALLLARFARPDTGVDDLADVPVAERDLMLLNLREQTLGPRLSAFAVCPACRQELEFALETLEIKDMLSQSVMPAETAIEEFKFRLRRLSTSDLASIASASEERGFDAARRPTQKTRHSTAADVCELPEARAALAARCIAEATRDGLKVEVQDIPKRIVSRLADYLDDLEDGAEILIAMTCPACQHSWQVGFDIATYFYAELTVLARRLLEEVHVLASAYGWSERDILALSPARRQFYLERTQ